MKNIILIGLMGCGKTTIGKILSEKLKMNFIDVDKFIEDENNMTIKEIFKKLGEAEFRKIESETILKISDFENYIISTGGGVILNEQNIINLQKNGIIIFLNRSVKNILKDINISNRPLLLEDKNKLNKLYNERINLYKKYSDIEIINNKKIEEIIKEIIFLVKED